MKAVILAGGFGSRLREETEFKPKPLIPIGDKPILWHIMKNLAKQGINEFIIAGGYKHEMIKDYFLNMNARQGDLRINTKNASFEVISDLKNDDDWVVSIVNTGLSTMTGGRILALKEHIGDEKFICTYGDGLADIEIEKLIAFHNSHNGIATVTAAKPPSRFGILDIGENNQVVKFTEKPLSLGFVNAGFFCFEPEVFNYLAPDSILEREPLEKIASNGELFAYKHHGFWKPMDTIRDTKDLIEIWNSHNPPWKNW